MEEQDRESYGDAQDRESYGVSQQAKHTPLEEALAHAYVRGWNDGLEGFPTDASKFLVAHELLAAIPEHVAAPDLLLACEDNEAFFASLAEHDPKTEISLPSGMALVKARLATKAAIAKAKPQPTTAELMRSLPQRVLGRGKP